MQSTGWIRGGRVALGVALVSLSLAMAAESRAEGAPTCPRFVDGSKGLPVRGEWRTYPVFGDLNGDGLLDLVGHERKGEGPSAFLGDGQGGWTRSSEGLFLPGFSCGVGVDLADVNGDGHLDLGVADHCRGIFVFFGDGAGNWTLGPVVDAVDRNGREDVAFGDVDGDGHQDLLTIGTGRGGLRLFTGDGTGRWRRKRDTGLPEIGVGLQVLLVDLNGDTHLDIAASYNSEGVAPPEPTVWTNDGTGRFSIASQGLPASGRLNCLATGDLDNDGVLDLALSSDYDIGYAQLLLYRNDGSPRWSRLETPGLPAPFERGVATDTMRGVELVDLNGDGHLDLAAVNHPKAGVAVWLADGAGGWHACGDTGLPTEQPGLFGFGVTAADVNADGKPDLAVAFGLAPEGSLQVWLQE